MYQQDSILLMKIRNRVDELVGHSNFRKIVDVVANFFWEGEANRDADRAYWDYLLAVEDVVLICIIHKYQDKELLKLREEHNRGFFSDAKRTDAQRKALRSVYEMVKAFLKAINSSLNVEEIKAA